MSKPPWPPVLIRCFEDEVQVCLRLQGALAQLAGLLSTLCRWHDEKHRASPNAASSDFTRAIARQCAMMTDMQNELGRTLDYAKAAAGLEAVVGEGNVGSALAFSPLDGVDEYHPNFQVVEHPDTPKDEGLAA